MKRKNINNKLKINVGLKHCDKCEYYLRCEECAGSLYKEEMPKLNKQIKDLQDEQVKEMLEHQEAMELANITITNLQDRVDKLERALIDSDLELRVCYKALELANVNVAEYLEQAKEILKNE